MRYVRAIWAIDPGPTDSGVVEYFVNLGSGSAVGRSVVVPNEEVSALLHTKSSTVDLLVIEMIASYGMAVGAEVFETCVWIGRFMEVWSLMPGRPPADRLARRDVKLHMCGSSKAKDANIRQAVIDCFGGKEKAIGKKAAPGPLYGVKGDCWQALALAMTCHAKLKNALER